MGERTPEEIALEFVRRINSHDLDGLTDLMSEDHTFVDIEGGIGRGREAMRNGWSQYFSAFPEYQIDVVRVVPLGDVVLLIGRTAGSHVPREIELIETVIWSATIEDGFVTEWRIVYTDAEKVKSVWSQRSSHEH